MVPISGTPANIFAGTYYPNSGNLAIPGWSPSLTGSGTISLSYVSGFGG